MIIDESNIKIYKSGLIDFKERYKDEPSVIFTFNGVTVLNVLHGMNSLNIKIEDDLEICVYDDLLINKNIKGDGNIE